MRENIVRTCTLMVLVANFVLIFHICIKRSEYHSYSEKPIPPVLSNVSSSKGLPSNQKSENEAEPLSRKIIISSNWRSGSSFLTKAIDSHPDVFSHYEPLNIFGIKKYNGVGSSDDNFAATIVYALMKCEYPREYLVSLMMSPRGLRTNQKLWKSCSSGGSENSQCFQKEFLESKCKSYDWTSMKLIRLRVRLLKSIMEDDLISPHLIFLIRDPRAILSSRMTLDKGWCNAPVCIDPAKVCASIEDDLGALREFSHLFPGQVHLLRYEDLCSSPVDVVKKLFLKLSLDFHPWVRNFLASSTTQKSDSCEHILDWTTEMDAKTLNDVQNACFAVMKSFGYKAVNSTGYKTKHDDVVAKFVAIDYTFS